MSLPITGQLRLEIGKLRTLIFGIRLLRASMVSMASQSGHVFCERIKPMPGDVRHWLLKGIGMRESTVRN